MTKPQRDNLSEERKLDELCERFARDERAQLSEQDWNSLREQHRLELYKGEYVVFRDHYSGKGKNKVLEKREVLCHSKRLRVVQDYFNPLSKDQQAGVIMDYVAPEQNISM